MNQELINNIKIWINNDNQIKELQKKIKLLREDKKKCTIKLVNMMKENDIDALLTIDNPTDFCSKDKIKIESEFDTNVKDSGFTPDDYNIDF